MVESEINSFCIRTLFILRHLCIEKMPQKCKPDTLLNIGLRCLAQHIDLICYGARHVNHREKRLRERRDGR